MEKNDKLKKFFVIWTGQAFSLFGSSVVDFALIWWLTKETGSTRMLVFANLIALLPRMVLGPFAGTLIDRTNRRTVAMLADGAIALVTVGLFTLFSLGVYSPWIVLVVILLRSLGTMFHEPAMKSITALMVPEDKLTRIGGLNRVLTGAMSIVAPVAGAALLEVFDVRSTLLIDIVTAAIAIGTMAFVTVPDVPRVKTATDSVVQETREGLQYVLHTKAIFFVVGTCTCVNICCGPCNALKSLFVTDYFGGGVMELSWVTAACGAGLILGGILMGVWGGFKRNLITSGIGWGGVGIGYFITGLLPQSGIWWYIGLMLFANIFNAIGCTGLEAFYESKVPAEYHGRVFSVLSTLDNFSVPFGLIIAAILGDRVPISFWFAGLGVLHFGLFVFWMFSKELKRAEE